MNLSETRRQTLFDLVRVLVTLAMAALAAGGIFWVTQQQHAHPWTRDGQVLASVVHVAPQVSGPVVAVHVVDNQLIAKGDPLFEIDSVLYRQAVQQAQANLAQASAEAKDAAADAERALELHARDDLSQQDLDLKTALAASKAAAVDAAKVALETAHLNLSYTQVSAASAGYVTNLELDTGTYAAAGESVMALIDTDSFWVAGYFKETDLPFIAIGDPAVVTLMGHPDKPLAGRVQSIAFGIARRNMSATLGDLAQVAPTFEWIRLAQRIPVRIALESPPADLPLRVGYTASVAINPSPRADRD
ncbi:HlyD family secretion protein [Lamprobacter modestohalophilus]|uniref:HlyD family secretion protein n=1 Tax=Lamprobacter modestohalophilus TaxID=1064514 RepID=UPI002ADEE539|nr:HlyD family secretion protein [Lamprobacter modestohalophilus]MEA1052658.1 HlyD family secretion protein [Lamprobacter modestohalophilus]